MNEAIAKRKSIRSSIVGINYTAVDTAAGSSGAVRCRVYSKY